MRTLTQSAAWSAASLKYIPLRTLIDGDRPVNIADGHHVKGIMWESITTAALSAGDSTGISSLKSDGLGFGTPELCLSKY